VVGPDGGGRLTLRLVDTDWSREIVASATADPSRLRIVSPFIKLKALERLLATGPRSVQVLTRFSLEDFARGVSDISALRRLVDAGAEVRGVRHLHAKLYLFGRSQTIITSANLTSAALDRNHEFGVTSADRAVISSCDAYFDQLWNQATPNLRAEQLEGWRQEIDRRVLAQGATAPTVPWPDYGADAGLSPADAIDPVVAEAGQAFVKFLGERNNRVPLSHTTLEEVERSGAHWAVAYPASKRPRRVRDNDIMFIGRMTYDPWDIIIFGRALAQAHRPGEDDATEADIALRPWKATWPRYIRVHNAVFVAGTLANGVSLNALMDALGPRAFASTLRNLEAGKGGNTDPRQAYRQQAAVQLTDEAQRWLADRLQTQFDTYGIIPLDTLDTLDWPETSLP
jgi:hypothetical protein